jgi:hypothetical protein
MMARPNRPTRAVPREANSSERGPCVKTAIPIASALEHEILEWAINSDIFEDVQAREVPDWGLWNRTGVLTAQRLTMDLETPYIATYARFILRRLEDLSEGAKDGYTQAAKRAEKRIRRCLESKLALG